MNLEAYIREFVDQRGKTVPETWYLHSPAYRAENSGALRQDWPGVPLPADRSLLLASAELGQRVAALLDSQTPNDCHH
jgi:hypothetical protein